MSISPNWFTEKRFFLHQAAALWNDCEPATSEYAFPSLCPNVLAVENMLVSEIRLGNLSASYESFPGRWWPNILQPVITREDLTAFAERIGRRPRFLFGPPEPTDAQSFSDFLVAAMKSSPERNYETKAYFRKIAVERYGLTAHEFAFEWHAALKETRANWSKPGARKKTVA